ncbi:zinc finger protein 660-like [Pseudomyrmex gracilis]|uniref:zinc finger protein 660-like n=1 Tax=Pseudomyrmex gracilis TaxID=219809 RepID=UPI000994EB17|nr:zinc finger protein 660-like [Pseudomyrmex gracilis]
MQKMEETSKNQRHSLRLDKKQNDITVKSNINIVDTSESNLEIQKSQSVEKTPVEMKHSTKDKCLEKYSWLCTDCNETLPSLVSLVEHHEKVHNQPPKYMCVQCSKVYDKYQGFVTHVKRHGKQDKEKYSCDECGKTYTQQKNLVDHMWIHTGERPYKCKSCDKSFKNSSSLFIHKRCHLPDNLKYQYQCDQCDKKFSTKPNLVTHKLIHTGVRNFTCDQCGKSFMQKGNLEAHFLTHTEEKPYKCSICPKAFKTPMQLKKHDLVHTDIKPHQCAVCGKTFREKSTLKEHSRIHSNAMPFTCEYCGKAFRFKGVLVTHKRQHTGERPYSCMDCQHHFTNWPNYQKHMRRRHGINIAFTRFLPKDQLPIQLRQSMKQTQPPQIKEQSCNQANPDNPLPISAVAQPESATQVIQTIPHAASQQTVARAIPTTTVQSFQTDVTSTVQETVFREQNTTYFTTVSVTPDLLPTNLPYHFYTMSNVTGNI